MERVCERREREREDRRNGEREETERCRVGWQGNRDWARDRKRRQKERQSEEVGDKDGDRGKAWREKEETEKD